MALTAEDRKRINTQIRAEFGEIVTRENLRTFAAQHNVPFPYWIANDEAYATGNRGQYRVPVDEPGSTPEPVVTANKKEGDVTVEPTITKEPVNNNAKLEQLAKEAAVMSSIPKKMKEFVKFGDYDKMESIIKSNLFFPVFITGLSGNGKTFGVEQACANLNREYIRANITLETDEDDLLGGFRLKDGNTVFEPGPAIVAMIRGAVLMLDEIDLASPKIMCLQPILEGKSVTLKKLGVVVNPAPGFTVFATANTKGRGSEDGKFVGTGLLNEAFLERFPVTIEQAYPDVNVEKEILRKTYEMLGGKMDATVKEYFNTLAKWASGVRETYFEGGIEDLISTRRLVHIVKAYVIFTGTVGPLEAQAEALALCINRFDAKVKDSLVDFYNKLAPDATAPDSSGSYGGTKITDPDA
jgi:hypothetical protein